MHYKESKEILKEVKKAKKVLLNCHRGPDPDSIGSALAMFWVLKGMGKEVGIVCPSTLDKRLKFLKGYGIIKSKVDFRKFNFKEYDLFIALDSSSWDMVVDKTDIGIPRIPIIKLDHHQTNEKFGKINLVDSDISSVGELVYRIFEDWKVKYDSGVATALMAAIIGDTGIFRFSNTTNQTLKAASELLGNGAKKNKIIFNLYRSLNQNALLFVGEVLKDLNVDKQGKFVWAAVPYQTFKKFKKPEDGKELATSIFSQSVDGTRFGYIILEKEKQKYSISFRSRDEAIDVSKLAVMFGGGGHKAAAGGGGSLDGDSFDEAVEKVLKTARKFAKENEK